MFKFNTIEECLLDLKQGKLVVVVDDEDRENEGDLLGLAETITGESINFMATHGRGLICMPLDEERLHDLGLHQMVSNNTDNHSTAFTVSVDHVDTTTGISAFERAHTIKMMLDSSCKPEDLRRPGHIFPLRAKPNGVLERPGHTEAAVDLAKLCGCKPAGVICEIMKDDGTMARLDDLQEYCSTHSLKIMTIKDLIEYRELNENHVAHIAEASMPTKYGEFKIHGYVDKLTNKEHIALVKGDISKEEAPLIRIHSECMTGDVFGSLRCDCGDQLADAMSMVNDNGSGIIVYLRQEGRGIGLVNKIRAYSLQDNGRDTVDANTELGFEEDMRKYYMAAGMLKDLGVDKVRLMTNNPQKIYGLEAYGIDVLERVPIVIDSNPHNEHYLSTKKIRMAHLI
jgi:3,4-dihydroxy 2-butanone 4-phosphate synthase/GTP cyclohydrolase II